MYSSLLLIYLNIIHCILKEEHKLSERTKNSIFLIYRVLLAVVLVGQFSNWIFDYNDDTIQVLNTAMFSLIGVAYLVFSWFFNKKLLNLILAVCGTYLIVMTFFSNSILTWTLAIISILTPMILGKFLPEEADNEDRLAD